MSAALPGPFRRQQTARSIASTSSEKHIPQAKPLKPVTLAKRLLFQNLPADADLPPLLLSPSVPPELNKELYDFIAIALRAYVHPWWTKITRYDKEFLPAITRVLTAVIQTIEARLTRTDLSPLLLRDFPILLTQHVVDYRNASSKLHSSYAAGGVAGLPQLFHQMQPHMALSVDGRVEEVYIRQVVDEVLRACLPPEDYDPESERYIVREIIVKVVLDGVIPRVTEPWFIHQSILNLLGPEKNKGLEVSDHAPAVGAVPSDRPAVPSDRPALPRRSSHAFSFQALAIVFFSTVQSISGACLALLHGYKHVLGTIKKVNQSDAVTHEAAKPKPPQTFSDTIPGSLGILSSEPASSTASPPTPPSPPASVRRLKPSQAQETSKSNIPSTPQIPAPSAPPPDYVSPSLLLFGTLLSGTPRSMPLALMHILTLLLLPFSALISRLLPLLLYTHMLSGERLVHIVHSAQGALFPGGWPAVAPPDPTSEEQAALRKETARRLLALIPRPLPLLLGSSPALRHQAMDEILEPFSSQECNTHLIILLLDSVLLTLFPEMGVNSAPSMPADTSSTPSGSFNSVTSLMGDLTPPRPDSRPP